MKNWVLINSVGKMLTGESQKKRVSREKRAAVLAASGCLLLWQPAVGLPGPAGDRQRHGHISTEQPPLPGP